MNKDNAHLYLPLVQALADGKTIQVKNVFGQWIDVDMPSFTILPSGYRIKPLSFPPKPEQFEWHNPNGLTAEQVGDGYRLLTTKENKERHPASVDEDLKRITQLWEVDKGKWDESGCYTGNRKHFTYRVPLSTLYPDGSKIVDGQLVKPWVPKFKVGDRVRSRDGGVIVWEIGIIDLVSKRYGMTCDSVVCWDEDELELAPLPEPEKHVPLGPEDWLKDGPWWVRSNDADEEWFMVSEVTLKCISYGNGHCSTHNDATSYERTNDGINWSQCHKPA